LLLIVEFQSIKAKYIVIDCCLVLGNNPSYRHLYGYIIFSLARASSDFLWAVRWLWRVSRSYSELLTGN